MRNIQVVKNAYHEPSMRVVVNDNEQGDESIDVVSFRELTEFIIKYREK